MSEESILILNMLREGKITAEQADSLLRAVRETGGAAPPPSPAPPPAPPSPDAAAMDSMQARLAELQGKLGDLQGKLGAAQAVKSAGQAASLAGKVLDHLPRPDLDMGKINKAVDEAMRGLNSLKNDALKTARTAARQASQEARKAAREGRRAFKFDFNVDFGPESSEDRPANSAGKPEAAETSQDVVTWTGAERLLLENKYGRIKVVGSEAATMSAQAVVTKTAWAGTEAEARILLQQVFLTHQVDNGQCKIGVAAPQDARDRLIVDYEITVPRGIPLEISATFGEIAASGVSGALRAKTVSGPISLTRPWGPGETQATTVSGNVTISDWKGTGTGLTVETSSGDVTAGGLAAENIRLCSRSGDVRVTEAHAAATAAFESASGDVSVTASSADSQVFVLTQSGHAAVHSLRAAQIQVETVSGDAELRDIGGALTAKTVSGDFDASRVASSAASLLTVSGDARWAFTTPFGGSFAGTTVSGDLHLIFADSVDARMEMNTTSGALSMTLPVTDSVLTERHIVGKAGAGSGSVRLQSVSGDLTIAAS